MPEAPSNVPPQTPRGASPRTLPRARVGFLGFGSMARAIARGLARAGVPGGDMRACARDWARLSAGTAELGAVACRDAREVAQGSDVVFVAVKPDVATRLCASVADALAGRVVVSVAWGVTLDDYLAVLPDGAACVTTIPNLAVGVCEGAWLVDERDTLSTEQRALVDGLLGATGSVTRLPARLMDAGGTIASCAPAWAAMFVEALADAGVKHGLPRAQANLLAERMVCGTGRMLEQTGQSPAALKDAVCSPGGATIRGVAQLERGGMRAAVIDAVDAVLG